MNLSPSSHFILKLTAFYVNIVITYMNLIYLKLCFILRQYDLCFYFDPDPTINFLELVSTQIILLNLLRLNFPLPQREREEN